MADRNMKIALLLTAQDKLSMVVRSAVNSSINDFERMQQSIQQKTGKLTKILDGALGALMKKGGQKGLEAVVSTTEAYGDQEEAINKLKGVLMGSDGLYNEATLNRIKSMSQDFSELYANDAKAYINMFRVFKANRINEKDVMGGIGEATAKLADYFDQMDPASVALFTSRMKNDFGIINKEIPEMIDLLARLKDSGVGAGSGATAVYEMTEFFGKASLGMANLKAMGLQQAKELGIVGGYFISRGLSAATVGTNFRRIFDTVRNPDRMKMMADQAQQLAGIKFNFLDKDGKFLGMSNFVQELGKMRGLDPGTIDKIVSKPFGGKQGLSSDFINFLALEGTDKYKEFADDVERQANVTEKLKVQMEGLNYEKKVFDTSWTNTKATFGATIAPLFKMFYTVLNKISIVVRKFIEQNPKLTKFIASFMLFGSIALMIGGAVLAVQGFTAALSMLGVTISVTPLGWMLTTVGLLSTAFANWDTEIVVFGKDLGSVGDIMVGMAEIVWNVVKPLVQLLAIIDQIGTEINNLLGLTSDADASIKENGFANFINWADNGFAEYNNKSDAKRFGSAAAVGMRWSDEDMSYVPINKGGNTTLTYSPVIHVGAGANAETVAQTEKVSRQVFEEGMKKFIKEQERKKY